MSEKHLPSSLLLGAIGFVLGVLGNLLASWLERDLLLDRFSPLLVAMLVTTAAGLLVWTAFIASGRRLRFGRLPEGIRSLKRFISSFFHFVMALLQALVLSPTRHVSGLLIYAFPLALGFKLRDIIEIYASRQRDVQLSTFLKDTWILVPLLALSGLGLLFRRYNRFLSDKVSELRNAVRYLYIDLDLPLSADSATRCTIWVSAKNPNPLESFTMRAVISGFPRRANTSAPFLGRPEVFVTHQNGKLLPRGIIGLCVTKYFALGPSVILCRVPDGEGAVVDIAENWNLSRSQAEAMIADARSFLCIPMGDRSASNLLGVLYFESSDPDVLSKEFERRLVERHLPRFAHLLVA